jgi:hypothetical protein
MVLAVLALTAGALGSVPAPPAIATTCPSGWNVTTTQSPGSNADRFAGLDGLSFSDAWAVGTYRDTVNQTLAEHWDGSAWTLEAPANISVYSNELSDVSMNTSTDVWAVGSYAPTAVTDAPLTERWNGASWSTVASPNPGVTESGLFGVAALSGTNAWAVGDYDSGSVFKTMIVHWDGGNWTQVPSPNPGNSNGLDKVSALSPTNVWAAGSQRNGGTYQPLVEHWNGTKWKTVASPTFGMGVAVEDIDAISAKDVWVVGFHETSNGQRPLLLHWDGTKFSKFSSRLIGAEDHLIYGVDDNGPKNVWAVGSVQSTSPTYQTIVLHWNGKSWKASQALNPGDNSNSLTDVLAEGNNQFLAVGTSYNPINALAETKCP